MLVMSLFANNEHVKAEENQHCSTVTYSWFPAAADVMPATLDFVPVLAVCPLLYTIVNSIYCISLVVIIDCTRAPDKLGPLDCTIYH